MKVPLLLTISASLFLAIAALYDVNYLDYEKRMSYSQWENITFHDFKGLKKPGMKLHGVTEFAFIKTNHEIHYQNGQVSVTTYFYPSRSYVFAQDMRNPDLLRHELYHFHIAEYFSRLLRETISQHRGFIAGNSLESLNRQYYRLEDEMQQQYDEDTYHSYVLQEQKQWELKIDSLLYSLRAFSNPVVALGNKQ